MLTLALASTVPNYSYPVQWQPGRVDANITSIFEATFEYRPS
jgi:hypothetical protein